MKKLLILTISPAISTDEAWSVLDSCGFTVLYAVEDLKGQEELAISNNPRSSRLKEQFPWILKVREEAFAGIDWQAQWAAHAPEFCDGAMYLDLMPYGCKKTLKLRPGPGFGDCSHQTTRLVLKLMQGKIKGQHVLDIGSGSGVLTLAAKAMGAKTALGIDIDRDANQHAAENANHNRYKSIQFLLPEQLRLSSKTKGILLMNMLMSEQEIAWHALSSKTRWEGRVLTSGILKDQHQDYLKLTKSWGWAFTKRITEGQWAGYCFETVNYF